MYEKEEKKCFQICTYTGSGSTSLTLTHPVRFGKWPIVWPEFCAQSWPADAEPPVPLRLWAGHWRLGLHVLLRRKWLPASLTKVGSYGGWIRCWIWYLVNYPAGRILALLHCRKGLFFVFTKVVSYSHKGWLGCWIEYPATCPRISGKFTELSSFQTNFYMFCEGWVWCII